MTAIRGHVECLKLVLSHGAALDLHTHFEMAGHQINTAQKNNPPNLKWIRRPRKASLLTVVREAGGLVAVGGDGERLTGTMDRPIAEQVIAVLLAEEQKRERHGIPPPPPPPRAQQQPASGQAERLVSGGAGAGGGASMLMQRREQLERHVDTSAAAAASTTATGGGEGQSEIGGAGGAAAAAGGGGGGTLRADRALRRPPSARQFIDEVFT